MQAAPARGRSKPTGTRHGLPTWTATPAIIKSVFQLREVYRSTEGLSGPANRLIALLVSLICICSTQIMHHQGWIRKLPTKNLCPKAAIFLLETQQKFMKETELTGARRFLRLLKNSTSSRFGT